MNLFKWISLRRVKTEELQQESKNKFCMDCRYIDYGGRDSAAFAKCNHPKGRKLSMISGEADEMEYCSIHRDKYADSTQCGKEGRWFEVIETQPASEIPETQPNNL